MITKGDEVINRRSELEEIEKQTNLWFYHWAEKDIEKYITFYHKDFKNKGRGLKSYKKYKEKIFKRYKQMKMSLTDLRVFVHENYAISAFNQDFFGDDNYVSKGRKVLYWYKDKDNTWKIYTKIMRTEDSTKSI